MERKYFDDRFISEDSLLEQKEDKHSCLCSKTLSKRPHLHPEIEIIICIRGEAEVSIDNVTYKFGTGDMCVVFPNQIHSYKVYENGEFLVIIFTSQVLPNIKENVFSYIPKSPITTYRKIENLNSSVLDFVSKYQMEFVNSNVLLTGYINIFMYYMLPHLNLNISSSDDHSILKKVCDYCRMNYINSISLDDIATELQISAFKISRIFNQYMHMTIPYYLNLLRISKACKLLWNTEENITEIATKVGFTSFRSFNRNFLKIMKTTPSEYRLSNK